MLEKKLKDLPDSAGVYKFFNQSGSLLYIGKAKFLKRRVKSYFRFTPSLAGSSTLSARIAKMISEAYDLEYILCAHEYDALILENSLIKELKPKYNILLRDDKTYPYISLDMRTDFPRFEITRKVEDIAKIKYFGPFSSGAKEILQALYLSYKLVQKKSCIKGKKTCLFYQIQKCHGPCEGKITKEDYMQILLQAKDALIDRRKLIKKMQEMMQEAVDTLRFEEAALLRDVTKAIEKSLHVIELDLAKAENFDLFAIVNENNLAAIMILFIRDGKLVSTINKTLKNATEFDLDEFYKRVMLQFYNTNPQSIPHKIYTAHDFEYKNDITSFIINKFGITTHILHPKIGDKSALCKRALHNAREDLEKYKKEKMTDIHEQLQEYFHLKKTPLRIEAFDNSHISGDSPVGCMVVYEDGFIKEAYRKFNLLGRDEYAQMQEMLKRRIEHFVHEPTPDLWLLDGGQALVNLAKKLLDIKGYDIDIIGIAKEKRDAKAYRAKSKASDLLYLLSGAIKLETSDKMLLFLQKIRDESHRFAISSFRTRKQNKDLELGLKYASGIGEASIKKLLLYFGTFENIYNAHLYELQKLLGEKNGDNFYKFLNT
ncbi:MAG: excinuclease ABC subunit UvrC [Sulfurospirillum sp.]|nr:excinuclease ABC subunit UvrC [Sulfurospirillum sp.]